MVVRVLQYVYFLGTLIANWKEERDMMDATGITRTKFN